MGLVRLFLAYVVACDHWRVVVAKGHDIPDWTNLGFNAGYAVMFFYIISGFLITYTLSKNYGPDDIGRFYGKRFIRIFSLYWPVVLIVFALFPHILTQFLGASSVDKVTAIFLFGQEWNVSFGKPGGQYFGGNVPLLNQSWTLGAELTFYLIAPFILRRPRLAAGLLVLSLALRAAFVAAHGSTTLYQPWTYTFFPSSICFFLLGYFAALAYQRYEMACHRLVLLATLPLIIAIMQFGPRFGFDTVRFWACVVLFVVMLPSLFENTKNSRVLNALGDLSYPLYLIHIVVMVRTSAWINSFSWATEPHGRLWAMWLFAGIAIVAAAAVSYLVEKPVAKTATWVWRLLRAPARPALSR